MIFAENFAGKDNMLKTLISLYRYILRDVMLYKFTLSKKSLMLKEREEDIIREIKKQVVEAYKTGPIEKKFTPEFKKLLKDLDVSIARGECPEDFYMETYFTIPLGDEAKTVDVKTQNNGRAIVDVLLCEEWGEGVGAEWSQTFVMVKTGSTWLIDDVLVGDFSFKNGIIAFFNSDGRR